VEAWVNRTKKPFIFRDWDGNLYAQRPGDKIAFNFGRRAVSDAVNITNLSRRIIGEDWLCVDIGACIGATSVPMWKKVSPRGRVYSIEADPRNIERIRQNLILNRFPAEFVYNYAICDRNEDVELNVIPGENGWQSLGDPRADPRLCAVADRIKTVTVKGRTLEEFCKALAIEKIDLLKIDVEGAEQEVFKGAARLLAKGAIRYLAFEISPPMLKWFKDNRTAEELINFVAGYNYRVYRILDPGNIGKLDPDYRPGQMFDCLAVAPGLAIPSDLIAEE